MTDTITLDAVLKTIHKLPPLPTVVMELLASMTQEDLDIDVLTRKIGKDQVLTAKTLKIANSTFYGLSRQVATVNDAIVVLGFQTIRNLVTTTAMVHGIVSDHPGGFDVLCFWRHSIATATCANAMAMELGVYKNVAYTAGLLHDIGRLVLATQFSAQYEVTMAYQREHDCDGLQAERATLGIDHMAVGEALAQHWRFPVEIQTAIAQHHQPTAAAPLGMLVCVADAVAHGLDLSAREDDLAPPLDIAVVQSLKLSDAAMLRVFRVCEKDFQAACLALSN